MSWQLAVQGTWCGRIHVRLNPDDKVSALKSSIEQRTNITSSTQRLAFGFPPSALAGNNTFSILTAGIQENELIRVSVGDEASSAVSTIEAESARPSIAGGVLDGAACTEKRRVAGEQESHKQTKRERSITDAGKSSEPQHVAGMSQAIGTLTQAKSAKYKELGGMAEETKKGHFEGDLPDTRKIAKPTPKKNGIHGLKKKK